MAEEIPEKKLKPLVDLLLKSKVINLAAVTTALNHSVYYEGLKQNYGNALAASEQIGCVYENVLSFKRNFCPDIEWPRDPNRSLPDDGVRLNNHKPLSDEDFAPTKVKE